MTYLPENDPHAPDNWPGYTPAEYGAQDEPPPVEQPAELWPPETAASAPSTPETPLAAQQPFPAEPRLFDSYLHPPVLPPVRIPHVGHLCLLIPLAGAGFLITSILFAAAAYLHLFGARSLQQAGTLVPYILGIEGGLYLLTFAAALFVFPLFWRKSLMDGLQWNGATALRLRWHLFGAAAVCFLLALINGELMPGPKNAPIEKVFQAPGAAWLLFVFGVTFAPFFEETFFRGFLLPALCTACDWFAEKTNGAPVRPLGENGHPQWSVSAMCIASVATSVPFAWMHAQQTGYSLGPFLLLVGVSLVLCAVRLATRSLAASVVVHACYNFMLFSLMLIGTEGFRHLERM